MPSDMEIGDTFIPDPVTQPDFYPGETDTLAGGALVGGAYNSFYYGLSAEGGTSLTLTSGQSAIIGATPNWYSSYDPKPNVLQGHWTMIIRGGGAITLEVGVDAESDWGWNGGAATYDWTVAGSVTAPASWGEATVTLPTGLLTPANLEGAAFLLRVSAISGSVEFDYVDCRMAGAAGYFRETGSGAWADWQDRQNFVANASAGRARAVTARVLFGPTTDDYYSPVWQGVTWTPPVGDIRPQIDTAFLQIHGASYGGADTGALDTTPGQYFATDASNVSNGSVTSELASWTWEDYYPGLAIPPTPPRDAYWMWGQAATESPSAALTRVNYARGIAFDFVASSVSKPSVPDDATPGIAGIHYQRSDVSGMSGVTYETALSDFVGWVKSPDNTGSPIGTGTITQPSYTSFVRFDNEHGAAGSPDEWHAWASAPAVFQVRLIENWEVGDTFPSPGAGTLLATRSQDVDDETGPVEFTLDSGPITTAQQFAVFLFRTSGHGDATAWMGFRPLVLLPRFRWWKIEWEYLGGAIGAPFQILTPGGWVAIGEGGSPAGTLKLLTPLGWVKERTAGDGAAPTRPLYLKTSAGGWQKVADMVGPD